MTTLLSPISKDNRSTPTTSGPLYVLRVCRIRSCVVGAGVGDEKACPPKNIMCVYAASLGFVRLNISPACSGEVWILKILRRSGRCFKAAERR